MATRYFCDRCEAGSEKLTRVDIDASVTRGSTVTFAIGGLLKSEHRAELCAACIESLKSWLARKSAT